MRRILLSIFGLLFVSVMLLACSSDGNDGDSDQTPSDGDQIDEDGDTPDGDEDGDSAEDEEKEPDGEELAWEEPPACGSGSYSHRYMIPGPEETGYDAELDALALNYERQFHAVVAYPMAVNADVSVADEENRALLNAFLRESDGWDFEAHSGKPITEAVSAWHKVAGLYAGAGIVADAFRYGALRDQGAPCEEIERAKGFLLDSLEAMHLGMSIANVPGVAVRGFMRTDIPGYGLDLETTPVFDEQGNPLPEEKNNGTWREDQSGLYPNYKFEDSCSRDMILGWAAASAAASEVIRHDPAFSEEVKARLRDDAKAVVDQLQVVRDNGYDLEILDVDGRTTYHGYLNEHSVERDLYIRSFENGFYALMTLGIVGGFCYAAEDDACQQYLLDELIDQRELPRIARDEMVYMDMGLESNYSNYNMGFMSAWLASRYVNDEATREAVLQSITTQLYGQAGVPLHPAGTKMSLFDFTLAAAQTGGSRFSQPSNEPENQPVQDGVETLKAFPQPPYWDVAVTQCDEDELASGECTFSDGTETVVHFEGGRKGSTVCEDPIPKAIRRGSNYEWRSNPYQPNGGGDGSGLLPGVDFRVAYWIGRYTRLPDSAE